MRSSGCPGRDDFFLLAPVAAKKIDEIPPTQWINNNNKTILGTLVTGT
jgi:hypothetical protein